MNIAIRYTQTILKGNKYLLLSVPIVALIGYFVVFLLSNQSTIENIQALSTETVHKNYPLLFTFSEKGAFVQSVALVILLPFLHLAFLQDLYPRPLDFNLPIGPKNHFLSYILLSIVVYVYNLLIICLFNYLLQFYLQFRFMDDVKEAYDVLGYLYTNIPENTLLFNGQINSLVFMVGLTFFALLSVFLVGILYFQKYSRVKSIIFIIVFMTLSSYIGNWLWPEPHVYINQEFYVQNYPIFIWCLVSLLLYFALYHIIKNKEV